MKALTLQRTEHVAKPEPPVPTHIGRGIALRPPLKWAGGKRWLVPHLQPLWVSHAGCRLVEPFVGGLAVTLGLSPGRALLNDVNPHVINLYRWMKRGLVADLSMVNSSEAFYNNRSRFNHLVHAGEEQSKEAAEIFYYLNRTCYNGLCRFNRSGSFNTPFGRYKVISYTQDFHPYAALMKNWELSTGDFETIRIKPTDFVYADPPYDVEFTAYSKQGFGWPEQVRLAEWLSRHPGPVVASNQATPRIVDLYSGLGFSLEFVDAPRMISCTGDRTPAREVIATRGV